jgi:tartrate-resistant acid phosphatase type 5
MGDNRYHDGATNIFDSKMYYALYDVFSDFKSIPWYLVLGNHDCYGNPKQEIDLSLIYKQWNMPHNYYNLTVEIDSEYSASLLFLDGCQLSCEKYEEAWKGTRN